MIQMNLLNVFLEKYVISCSLEDSLKARRQTEAGIEGMSVGTVWPEMKLNSTQPKNSITRILEEKMIVIVHCMVMRVGCCVRWKADKAHTWFPCLGHWWCIGLLLS